MKKKLSCLLIALAMLAGMSSCGDGSASIDTSENAKYNMTLTLWLPTSEDTTDEAIAMVESEINKITKKNYKTAIDITAIPDDEYDEAIKNRVLEVEEAAKRTAEEEASRKKAEKDAKKRGETLPPQSTETTLPAETYTDDEGNVQEPYPAATADQLDIFCIRGYEDFAFYAENGYISPLDENLDASAKLLKSYIYPSFLQWARLAGDNATYAIPNNHVIGEYTCLMLNKDMCEKLYYDPSELTTLLDCQQFIEDIGKTQDTSKITPLLSETYATGMNFWNSTGDINSFSVLGSIVSDEADPTSRHNIRNVFGLKQFNNTVIMMKELKEQGYVGKDLDPKTANFGVGVITCDAKEMKEYEDKYHIQVIQCPRATNDDVYQSMFGVSLYSLDVTRSMEIITLINTDPTVRTLLQYGVEGIHWEYNEELTESGEQTIKIISDDYKMNLIDTGNVFMTYPGENLPMSYWEDGKQQNLDSMISPFLGFTNAVDEANIEDFEALDKYSAAMLKRINAMTAAEYEENYKTLQEEFEASNEYGNMTDREDIDTLVGRYMAFYEAEYQGDPVM